MERVVWARSAQRWSRRFVLAAVIAGLTVLGSSAGALADPVLPSQDPFYTWTGSLQGVAPGTVLRTRQIAFDASGLTVPVTATQLLFASRNELDQPAVAVTTVVTPLTGATHKLISYQWAYDGLAGNCDPSFALQGGTPTEGTNSDEQDLEVPMLLAGDTVVTTDYEGEDNEFVAGHEEGYMTLDGIRAAEAFLGFPASTQVAMMGYSGGAIATDWAAEEAPSYAPTLDFVGAAFGGIAVDLAHNLAYVNGSQEWSGAIPAALLGIARSMHIDLDRYLSAYGEKIMAQVGGSCLESDLGSFPGLTYQKLLKPQYTNIDQIPVFVHAIDALIMGTGGTPQMPMYMGVGDADGTGDDVMVDADDYALAHEYCDEGRSVEFSTYQNENHGDAGLLFLPSAEEWVVARLAGNPAESRCDDIPAGDSLAPLQVAPGTHTATAAVVQLQYRSAVRRTATVRVRALRAAAKVVVRLETARGRILASRHLTLPTGRLETVRLVARRRLAAGTYRVLVVSGRGTLASRRIRLRR